MLRKFKISVDGTQYLVEMEEVGAPTPTPADAAPGRKRRTCARPGAGCRPGPQHPSPPRAGRRSGSRGGGLPCPDRRPCPAPSSIST